MNLENLDKMLIVLCSDSDEQISFTVCSSLGLNCLVKLRSSCGSSAFYMLCSRGWSLLQLWGQPEPPAAGISLFPEEKKSLSLLTRGGFRSLLCEGGLAS